MIPQPAYEAPIATPFGCTHLVQSQYPWHIILLVPLLEPQEAGRASVFRPFVVPEASPYQTSTSLTWVSQNIT